MCTKAVIWIWGPDEYSLEAKTEFCKGWYEIVLFKQVISVASWVLHGFLILHMRAVVIVISNFKHCYWKHQMSWT